MIRIFFFDNISFQLHPTLNVWNKVIFISVTSHPLGGAAGGGGQSISTQYKVSFHSYYPPQVEYLFNPTPVFLTLGGQGAKENFCFSFNIFLYFLK